MLKKQGNFNKNMREIDQKLIDYAIYLETEISSLRTTAVFTPLSQIDKARPESMSADYLGLARDKLYSLFPTLEDQVKRAKEGKLAQKVAQTTQ